MCGSHGSGVERLDDDEKFQLSLLQMIGGEVSALGPHPEACMARFFPSGAVSVSQLFSGTPAPLKMVFPKKGSLLGVSVQAASPLREWCAQGPARQPSAGWASTKPGTHPRQPRLVWCAAPLASCAALRSWSLLAVCGLGHVVA